MKEHLEYQTAEDIDDLITELFYLTERIDRVREDFFATVDDTDLKATYKRSVERLLEKRSNLLRALKSALEGVA